MSNFDELIPGLESFMEDTTVETKVEVSDDGDAAADAEVTAGEEEEVSEASSEIEEDAEQAEMILSHYDRVDTMIAHLQRFGADRTFFSLMNADGYLTKVLQRRGVALPALESMDATGTPYSELSIACLEGLSEIGSSIGNFFSRMGSKMIVQFERFVEAVRQRLSSMRGNIKRLRSAAMTKQDNPARLERSNAKIFSLAQLQAMAKAVPTDIEAKANRAAAELEKVTNAVRSGNVGGIQNILGNLETMINDIKSQSKMFKGLKSEAKEGRVTLSEVSLQEAVKMLDLAETIMTRVENSAKAAANLKNIANGFKQIASGMSKQAGGDPDYKATAKRVAKLVVKVSKVLPKLNTQQMKIAKLCIRNAGQRISPR